MARVLFIIPRTQGRFGKPSTPHVGISYLASYIRAHGHEPCIIDLRVEPLTLEVLRKRTDSFGPDYLGFTSVSLEYQASYDFLNRIITWGYPVIYGGPHVSTVRRDIYRRCSPFAAVYGEGEEKLLDIIEGKPLPEIEGVIYRRDDGEVVVNPPRKGIADLDAIPFPAYELSRLDLYSERKIPLTTSRDCPYDCTYCNVKLVMGKGFRKRSPENVVAEIEHWYRKGYRLFGVNDDTFTSDMRRAAAICDLIVEQKLRIDWELRTGIRVDRVNEELLRKMKAAGCRFLAYGIESIDDEVLRTVKKGTVVDKIRTAVELTEKVGIPFSGFFMIGLPGDTPMKARELLRFARSYPFNEVRFYNLMPYPNTEAFEWVKRNGTFIEQPEEYLNNATRLQSEPVFETPAFPRKERVKAYNRGEALMVMLLLKKTLGPTLGALVGRLCDVNAIRRGLLNVGFRMTGFVRRLQALRS